VEHAPSRGRQPSKGQNNYTNVILSESLRWAKSKGRTPESKDPCTFNCATAVEGLFNTDTTAIVIAIMIG